MATKTTGFLGQELRKPDSQGRIAIGREYKEGTYSVEPQPNGDIMLRPVVVMHSQEAWLFANPDALASVKRGMEQAANGEGRSLGSFAQYVVDEDDED